MSRCQEREQNHSEGESTENIKVNRTRETALHCPIPKTHPKSKQPPEEEEAEKIRVLGEVVNQEIHRFRLRKES